MEYIDRTNNLINVEINKLFRTIQEKLDEMHVDRSLREEAMFEVKGKITGPIEVRNRIIQEITKIQLDFDNFLKTNNIKIEHHDGMLYLVDEFGELHALDNATVKKMELLGIYLDPAKKDIAMNAINEILTNLTETIPTYHTCNNLERRVHGRFLFNILSEIYPESNTNILGVSLISEEQEEATASEEELPMYLPIYFVSRIIEHSDDAFQAEKKLMEDICTAFKGETSLANIKEILDSEAIELTLGEDEDGNFSGLMGAVKRTDNGDILLVLPSYMFQTLENLIKKDVTESAKKSQIAYYEDSLKDLNPESLRKMSIIDDFMLGINLVLTQKKAFLLATYILANDLYQKGYYIEAQKIEGEETEPDWTLKLILPYGINTDLASINEQLNSCFINQQLVTYSEIALALGFQNGGKSNKVAETLEEYKKYLESKYKIHAPRLENILKYKLDEFKKAVTSGNLRQINPLIAEMEAEINKLPEEERIEVERELTELVASAQQVFPQKQINQILNLVQTGNEAVEQAFKNMIENGEVARKNFGVILKEEGLNGMIKRIKIPKLPPPPKSIWHMGRPTDDKCIKEIAEEYQPEKPDQVL